MCRGCLLGLGFVLALSAKCSAAYPQSASSQAQSSPASGSAASSASDKPHTIAVTFDYDFDKTPACTAKVTAKCVKQFIIYDISGGPDMPYKIGTVPLPENPTGNKKGITGKSDPRVFEPGRHLIAVVAREPEPSPKSGKQTAGASHSQPSESAPAACTTWVTIPE